jgi:VWFA-related protein
MVIALATPATFAAGRKPQTPSKPASQDQPIRLKTDLMEIRAVVTDKQGKLITGLNKADFEVLENGREQVVSFFSTEAVSSERNVINLPGTSPAARRQITPAARPKRTVVFFVDTLHMATLSLLRVKQELLKFIDERLGDEDMAAVVSTGGGLGVFSQFTLDKRVLRTAVNRLAISPASMSNSYYTPYIAAKVEAEDGAALAVAKSIVRQEEHLYDPHLEELVTSIAKSKAREITAEATYKRRETLLTLKAVADRLAELPGQRMILLLSDGFTLLDNSGARDADDLRAAISRAARSSVVIYSVNAKGLRGVSVYDIESRLPSDPQIVTLIQNLASAGDRELESGMERLAKGTGGDAFMTTNDLKGAFNKALDDNGFYYALSYYPANIEDKKSFRTIKVRVKGHADYSVRAQSGYLASDLLKEKSVVPVDPRKALIKVMGEPLAINGINVDASADFLYLPTDTAQVSVNVFIDGSKLGYKEQDNSFLADLTMLTGVLDSSGRTTDVLQDTMQIRLSREQLERARESVYHYTKRLTLKPGLYQIRVGVRDPQTEQMGTAAAWVEVPDPKSKKLILSSISTNRFQLDSDDAKPGAVKAVSQPNVRNGVNIFRHGDFITYYGKAHKAALGDQNAVGLMIQGQILQDDHVVLQDAWRPLSSFVLNKEHDSIEFGGRIRAAGFKPGFYALRILVKEPQSKAVLTKETSFEVIP